MSEPLGAAASSGSSVNVLTHSLTCLAIAVFMAAMAPGAHAFAQPAQAGTAPLRIVVDPGHGGADTGAVAGGLIEKEVNLAVALRLAQLLELDTLDTAGGTAFDVQLTRDDDSTVSLLARVTQANAWPADVFVSIHHNAFSSPTAQGTETYSFSDGTAAAQLRDLVQEELLVAAALVDRGSKTANFFVLRETSVPAVLSEAGFLTSPVDAAVIQSPTYVDDAARAHLFALQRWRGVAAYSPTLQPVSYCTAKVSGLGCVPLVSSTGSATLSGGTPLVITCENVVSQQFGLMIWSLEEDAIPFFGGTLCLGGSIVRTPIQNASGFAPGTCTGRFEFEMTGPYMQSVGLLPGHVLHAQFWGRDPYSVIPVGLSNALRVTVAP